MLSNIYTLQGVNMNIENLGLDLQLGETKRISCPHCGGYNTFTISNDDGHLVWNCYKLSCNVRGKKKAILNAEDLITLFKVKDKKDCDFVLPNCIVPGENRGAVIKFVNTWGISILDLMYDAREDRVVFPIKYGNRIVDAVGKALTRKLPKWKRYGKSPLPYQFGSGNAAVVVEDCISANVAGSVNGIVGVALLGTNLLEKHKDLLSQYSTVTVALDPDAMLKSLEMVRELRNYVSTVRAVKLTDDLKYKNEEDLNTIREVVWN